MITTIETNNILRPIRIEGGKPPLFIIHGVRGFSIITQEFIKIVDEDQPIYCLNARGFKGDQRPFDNIPDMAQEYITEIKKVQAEGPYCLMSFCAGAAVLLEITQQLKNNNDEVAPTIMLDPHKRVLASKLRQLKRKVFKHQRLAKLNKYDNLIHSSEITGENLLPNKAHGDKETNSRVINKQSNMTDIQANTERFIVFFKYALNNYIPIKQNIDVIRIFTPERDVGKKSWLKIIKGKYIEKKIDDLSNHDEIFNFANPIVIDNIRSSLNIVYDYLEFSRRL